MRTAAQNELLELVDLAMRNAADLRMRMTADARLDGRSINSMRNPDGTWVGLQLLQMESNLILAAATLRST